jgi:hypothetical protein
VEHGSVYYVCILVGSKKRKVCPPSSNATASTKKEEVVKPNRNYDKSAKKKNQEFE